MTTEFRYQSGHPTGAVLRQGRITHGRELRYIPGSFVPEDPGGCYPLFRRLVCAVSEVTDVVTGFEDTAWTDNSHGHWWYDALSQWSLPNIGDTISLNGLRFQCDDRLWKTFYDGYHSGRTFTGSGQPWVIRNNTTLRDSRDGGKNQWVVATGFGANAPQASVAADRRWYRAAMMGGSVPPDASHVKPGLIESMTIPQPFAGGFSGDAAEIDPGPRVSLLNSRDVDFAYYVTHARPVINGVVAGPLKLLGPERSKTRILPGNLLRTWTVRGVGVAGLEGSTGGSRQLWGTDAFTLEFFPDTEVRSGDVIGFDVWIQIVRENILNIVEGVSYDPATVDPGFPKREVWPQHVMNFPTKVDAQYGNVAFNNGWPNQSSWTIYPDQDCATYRLGNAAEDYNSNRHTYELDFGSLETWTPTGELTYKMDGNGGEWDHVNEDCQVYDTRRKTNGFAELEFGLNWDGDTCLLMVQWGDGEPEADTVANDPGHSAVEAGYYPRAAGTEEWDSHFLEHVANVGLLLEETSGPFNQSGVTIFDLAYTKIKREVFGSPQWVIAQQNYLPHPSIAHAAGPILNVPASIIVTRVDQ